MLPGIADAEGDGPFVVVEFSDLDEFYRYITPTNAPESTHGLASGVFLDGGYGHFAFPVGELDAIEPIAVHELTHALMCHLPLPTWLNEGIAVNTEDALTGSWPFDMNAEQFGKHVRFWTPDTAQEFWTGSAFSRPDEGQRLSYELARYAVQALSGDYNIFSEFVNRADFADGGEQAAIDVYEGSLGGLLEQFFGPGDWSPRPEDWFTHDES